MSTKSIVSITDYSKEQILSILDHAATFEANPNQNILNGKVAATLFFEPSTRTRLSFETAVNRLGGRVIGFSDASTSSSSKGETLNDTIRMVANYADIIIMRHFLEGAARYASEVSSVPVINAGDGSNQHPTQTMLDLYSIKKTQGRLDNLKITMVGDLKYGRTVHSLLIAMAHFSPTFCFVAPDELKMPEEYKIFCDKNNIPYTEQTEFDAEVINQSDILYMTRVQKERFTRSHGIREGEKRLYVAQSYAGPFETKTCASCIRSQGSMKSTWMWTATRKLIISTRHETDCMFVRPSSATHWD